MPGRSRVIAFGLIPLTLILGMTRTGAAQGNFEIQVYGAETVAPGATMLELHSNAALQGTTHPVDGVRPTDHAAHETLEITHGFTSWFETGLYIFTSVQPDTGWEWVGSHIRPRVRAPASWALPVGLGLSLEAGYQRRAFSTDTGTLEIRPIVDKKAGSWYLAFNPVFDRSLHGQGTGRGFEFAPNAKVSYDLTEKVSLGLEYYGAIGPLNRIDPVRAQQHLLFPVIDVDLGPRWEFNLGLGFGLTPSTDTYLIKMILGYRFDAPKAEGRGRGD